MRALSLSQDDSQSLCLVQSWKAAFGAMWITFDNRMSLIPRVSPNFNSWRSCLSHVFHKELLAWHCIKHGHVTKLPFSCISGKFDMNATATQYLTRPNNLATPTLSIQRDRQQTARSTLLTRQDKHLVFFLHQCVMFSFTNAPNQTSHHRTLNHHAIMVDTHHVCFLLHKRTPSNHHVITVDTHFCC